MTNPAARHMGRIRTTLSDLQDCAIAPLALRYASKTPAVDRWEQYQTTPPDDDTLQEWFWGSGLRNIGAICGAVSGGLVVLVFNSFDLYQAVFAGLDISRRTWVVQSKRGPHVYLRVTGPLPETTYFDIPGVPSALEVRSSGHYVVAAGSLHPEGITYEYRGNPPDSIIELADFDAEFLTPVMERAEQWDYPLVRQGAKTPSTPNSTRPASNTAPWNPQYIEAAVENELMRLSEALRGGRNNQLNRSAFALGQFVGAGALDRRGIEDALERVATRLGLHRHELRRTIQSGIEAGIARPRVLVAA